LLDVPRERYVPDALQVAAYAEENLPLGEGRVILQARTFAKILDFLAIGPDDLVLDVGAGLGYSTAVLARLAEAVVALEEDPAMAKDAEATLATEGVDSAVVIEATLAEGAPKHGPYDVIVVEGAVETVPEQIESQLKDSGRIAAIFAEGALGVVKIGHKIDGRINWRYAFNAGAPVLPGFAAERAFML
ncbi:MAG: methyltransferase domain-containing protein, partial [Pseudomonadota bacterium]